MPGSTTWRARTSSAGGVRYATGSRSPRSRANGRKICPPASASARVLFLDEPTAGVDVRSRALFWELIQEEAAAGATIFVTTHFLEEADYCDRVCFINAGRLVVDATPEELRGRYSAGYRIEVTLAPELRAAAAAELGRGATPDAAGVTLAGTALDPALLGTLAQLVAAHPDARVRIEQPAMTDVFRRVLTEAGARE
jgi:ABC-2 type transport system ATP-binding protein